MRIITPDRGKQRSRKLSILWRCTPEQESYLVVASSIQLLPENVWQRYSGRRGFFLWLLFPWSTWAALHVFEILCTFCCSRILLPLRSSRWWIAVLPLKPGLPRSYLLPLALHVKKHFNINKSQLGMLSFFSTHEEWRNGIFSISMLYLLANAPRIKEKKREQIILPYNCDNGKKKWRKVYNALNSLHQSPQRKPSQELNSPGLYWLVPGTAPSVWYWLPQRTHTVHCTVPGILVLVSAHSFTHKLMLKHAKSWYCP